MNDDFYCLHSDLCKTLANEKRQRILGSLRDGECSVSELVERTGIAQANLSQHLAVLRGKGIVRVRRLGPRAYYRIGNPKIIQAFDLITEVLRETIEERTRTLASSDETCETGVRPARRTKRRKTT